jgi:hypothetical protein
MHNRLIYLHKKNIAAIVSYILEERSKKGKREGGGTKQ